MAPNRNVLLFGYFDRASPRAMTIRAFAASQFANVEECHTVANGFLAKCRDLKKKFSRHTGKIDTVLVMFPGQWLVPFAWILTLFPRHRIIFDAFVSLYDAQVLDRRLVSRWNPYAWLLYLVDLFSCHLADEVLVDTEAQRQFFARTFFLSLKRIRVVYLETRADLFSPRTAPPSNARFEVFFYGTFIPLQGVEHILGAAAILQETAPDVHFTLVGGGQTKAAMTAAAAALHLGNITFVPFVALEALAERIRAADLNLGIFGTSEKALRVIPHKVIDAVACEVPVLTADTPAIRERYAHHPLVLLCPPGNAGAIAAAILERKETAH